MHDFILGLGWKVKDKISGFGGIISARAQYLTGCNQYGVNPQKIGADGAPVAAQWFDEGRLTVISKKGIVPESVQSTRPGGPNREAPR